jgi:hypothetical protein
MPNDAQKLVNVGTSTLKGLGLMGGRLSNKVCIRLRDGLCLGRVR